jgi:hypothetical protein
MSDPEGHGDLPTAAPPAIAEVGVGEIHDRGWRDRVDGADPTYGALLSSVRRRGVLVPLVVRRHGAGGYQLVSGARRLQAAREVGRMTVPVVVRELGETEALIGGAWAALTRSGVSDDEAARLHRQLVAAGVPDADARLLVASLPPAAPVELTGRLSDRPSRMAPAWAWDSSDGAGEVGRTRHRQG